RQKFALMETNRNTGIDVHLVRRSDYPPIGRLANRVASFQHAEWTERIQCVGNSCESLMRRSQYLVDSIRETLLSQRNLVRPRSDEGARTADLLQTKRQVIDSLR